MNRSERTTIRVIILVLVMLFGVPQLQAGSNFEATPTSSQYGVDEIMTSFTRWKAAKLENPNSALTKTNRDTFEQNLLAYIYFHNYFCSERICARKQASCALD